MSYVSHLNTMQPDYLLEEVDLYPNKSINYSTKKNQTLYDLIGERKCAFNLSEYDDTNFSFSLKDLTKNQRDILIDIYCNKYKANGKGKTFFYNHPIYNQKYICKFESSLKDFWDRNQRPAFSQISLSVIGYDRNLLSTSSWVVGSESSSGFISLPISSPFGYDEILDYDGILDYDAIFG